MSTHSIQQIFSSKDVKRTKVSVLFTSASGQSAIGGVTAVDDTGEWLTVRFVDESGLNTEQVHIDRVQSVSLESR